MRAAIAATFLLAAICAHEPETRPVSGFKLEVQPEDAELTVDGQPMGPVSQVVLKDGVLELEPGVHQMALKKKGYQTWRAEVALGSTVETLKVSLKR